MWHSPKGVIALVGAMVMLVPAAQSLAASPTETSSYTVGSLTVPGVDTGLVLKTGRSVTVTAT